VLTALAGAFVAGIPTAVAEGGIDAALRDELGPILAAMHQRGQATWPAVDVSALELAGEAGRRLGEIDLDALSRLCAPDLYLAVACARGDTVAIVALEQACFAEIDVAARRTGATDAQAGDVRAHLRRILFVHEPGRPAATSEYTGRGDLRGYVKVIATRELVRVVQRERREIALEDGVLDALASHADPQLAYLRDSYREEVSAALRAALEELEEQPRALLRYSLVDAWSIDRIAALYGVHRATAARWLGAARDRLGELIRARLAARLTIASDEVASIVRMVQSRVDVSIARALALHPA
jgi:RNA polymerase sigma-70 factor (ECF subfamily)